ncbi:MAG: hypothetical protein PHH75_06985 [Candidatus Omnitrophica bacterium]|nr:hypothetical protein [Candidatus Omnitrophota bacterium]MDD5574905.1 hypothetical protein [Candidatus Omnitrophota bacterium]
MKEKILAVLKLFLAILLLPFVIGITAAFWGSLRQTETVIPSAFGWGVVVYLILHILLYQPAHIFDTGKKITEKAMGFLSPLFKVAGFCVPTFTILSFLAYFLAKKIWPQMEACFGCFVFLAAFTLTMHLVFTANALKGKSAGWLKENYFFAIFSIYIINMIIVGAAFNLLTGDFYFTDFMKSAGQKAGAIYTASFKQLFEIQDVR